MGSAHLATYLNDHLAGAVGAIELMAHVEHAYDGHPAAAALGPLRRDIEADRDALRAIIERLDVHEKALRKAAGWLGERLLRLKLRVDDPAGGALRLFESLETIALGLEGKRTLWHALAAVAPSVPALQGVDYDRLIARAQAQRGMVEPLRLDAAREAFTAAARR